MEFNPLTVDNWDLPDETSVKFALADSDGKPPPSTDGHAWARAFLAIELTQRAPKHVRDLFAIARAACIYGWFFYPLYALAAEQLHRVAETAATERYRQLGGPKSHVRFFETIEWLTQQGQIPADETSLWTGMRHLRNRGSHPQSPVALPPGLVLRTATTVATCVNSIFPDEPAPLPGRPQRRTR